MQQLQELSTKIKEYLKYAASSLNDYEDITARLYFINVLNCKKRLLNHLIIEKRKNPTLNLKDCLENSIDTTGEEERGYFIIAKEQLIRELLNHAK